MEYVAEIFWLRFPAPAVIACKKTGGAVWTTFCT